MKRILAMTFLLVFGVNLVSLAQAQTTTKTYSNKFVQVTVKAPVYTPSTQALPETETEKKIKQTQSSIDSTKKNISDIKKTWGLK
jgi:hypothetical protein